MLGVLRCAPYSVQCPSPPSHTISLVDLLLRLPMSENRSAQSLVTEPINGAPVQHVWRQGLELQHTPLQTLHNMKSDSLGRKWTWGVLSQNQLSFHIVVIVGFLSTQPMKSNYNVTSPSPCHRCGSSSLDHKVKAKSD